MTTIKNILWAVAADERYNRTDAFERGAHRSIGAERPPAPITFVTVRR